MAADGGRLAGGGLNTPRYMQHTSSSKVRKDTLPRSFAKSPAVPSWSTYNTPGAVNAQQRLSLAASREMPRPPKPVRGMSRAGLHTDEFEEAAVEMIPVSQVA